MKTKLLRKFYRRFKWRSLLECWAYSDWYGDPTHSYVKRFAETVNFWKDKAIEPGFKCVHPHGWVNGKPEESWIDLLDLQEFFWKYRKYSTYWRKHGHFNSTYLSPENQLSMEAGFGIKRQMTRPKPVAV